MQKLYLRFSSDADIVHLTNACIIIIIIIIIIPLSDRECHVWLRHMQLYRAKHERCVLMRGSVFDPSHAASCQVTGGVSDGTVPITLPLSASSTYRLERFPLG